jgi:hypothetical protein
MDQYYDMAQESSYLAFRSNSYVYVIIELSKWIFLCEVNRF